jgi:hypothetical protein
LIKAKKEISGCYPADGKELSMKDFKDKVAVVTGAAR